MGFDFNAAARQLASINAYAGTPFKYGDEAEMRGAFNPADEVPTFNVVGGMGFNYSPTLKVSRTQIVTPVVGMPVKVGKLADGSWEFNLRVHSIKRDDMQWVLILCPEEQP